MRNIVLVCLLALAFSSCGEGGEKVYIAVQPPTKYYHSEMFCKYLKDAKFEEIYKKEALRYEKVPCHYCYSQYYIDEFNGKNHYLDDEDEKRESVVDYEAVDTGVVEGFYDYGY